MQNIYRQTWTQ